MHTHEKQLYDMKEVNYHQNDFDTSYAKYIYISSNGIASIFKALSSTLLLWLQKC